MYLRLLYCNYNVVLLAEHYILLCFAVIASGALFLSWLVPYASHCVRVWIAKSNNTRVVELGLL